MLEQLDPGRMAQCLAEQSNFIWPEFSIQSGGVSGAAIVRHKALFVKLRIKDNTRKWAVKKFPFLFQAVVNKCIKNNKDTNGLFVLAKLHLLKSAGQSILGNQFPVEKRLSHQLDFVVLAQAEGLFPF